MAKIYRELTELIGSTPMMELTKIEKEEKLHARLLVKIESFNPGGSVKDRVALSMIEAAEAAGNIKKGDTLIEPTSGNTGIGLAWVSKVKGYKLILTMPDSMSEERRRLLRAYGAELVLTPGKDGMKGAIEEAENIQRNTPGSVILRQFSNPANPEIHRLTTGEEIWNDTEGDVDIFIAGVGTGGTISGCARALKGHKENVCIVAVEPASSPVLSGGKAGPHKIQGIGAGFVPDNYDAKLIDKVEKVTDEEAFAGARMLADKEGLLVGISSGAAFIAALNMAKKKEYEGKTIVALLPDSGERYLSLY